MKTAYLFPGQGSQYPAIGKTLLEAKKTSDIAENIFAMAKDNLGFDIGEIMTNGTADDLKMTKVTQPAIYLSSIINAKSINNFNPNAVAGHSLGEISAITAAEYMSDEEGLELVKHRAMLMQKACETTEGTMAAIIGMENEKVEKICLDVSKNKTDVVVTANYNCIGQLVISGSKAGVNKAIEKCKTNGAKRVIPLQVSGAFHSPLMNSAQIEFEKKVINAKMKKGKCSVYQNVTATPTTDIETIKKNIIKQLTSSVKWAQSVQKMYDDGITNFIECGPGKVLQGLVKKIEPNATVSQVELQPNKHPHSQK